MMKIVAAIAITKNPNKKINKNEMPAQKIDHILLYCFWPSAR